MNKHQQELLTQISSLTRDIEDKYPELTKYLDETRSTLPKDSNLSAGLDNEDLENYSQQLKTMIEKYKKEH